MTVPVMRSSRTPGAGSRGHATGRDEPVGSTIGGVRRVPTRTGVALLAALTLLVVHRGDVDAALQGVPPDAPPVVMMHYPVTFPRLPPGSAPLAAAGHTHCGQIAIPGPDARSWYEHTVDERVAVDGWAPEGHGAPGNRLFVTCGIDPSVVPMRIAAPPQVVFFELRPAG